MLGKALTKSNKVLENAAAIANGGAGARQPGSDVPLELSNGQDISGNDDDGDVIDGQVGDHETRVVSDPIIEFVHFGRVHLDIAPNFAHLAQSDLAELEGLEASQPPDEEVVPPRALQFRAALQREALLLGTFMGAVYTVLSQQEGAKGNLGKLTEVGANLFGGTGNTATRAMASDIKPMFTKVNEIATAINVEQIEYATVHQSGIDLHQARLNYRAYLGRLAQPPKADEGGGVFGKMDKFKTVGGGISKALEVVKGIAFKPFEIFMAVFVRLERAYEPVIEKACHDLSLDAIAAKPRSAVFPIWSPPAEVAAATQSTSQYRAVRRVQNAVNNVANPVGDFLQRRPTEVPPGKARLYQALTLPRVPTVLQRDDAQEVPEHGAAALTVEAFSETLGRVSLPKFLRRFLVELMTVNTQFLTEIYVQLLSIDPNEDIPEDEVYRSGTRLLVQQLLRMLMDKLAFLRTADNAGLTVGGQQVSGGTLREKGEDRLGEALAPHVQSIVDLAMASLVDELNDARANAVANNALSMEVFLGRYPWLLALLFRNTFYRAWDLLVEHGFGSASDSLEPLMNTSSFFEGVRNNVRTAREEAKRAEDVANLAKGDGFKASNDANDDNRRAWNRALRKGGLAEDERHKLAERSEGEFVFPLVDRTAQGAGKAITLGERRDVVPNHQWTPQDTTAGA